MFVAVGTPTRRGDGHADLSYVYQAVQDIAPYLKGYTVIVDKSTVPVGTARNVKRILQKLILMLILMLHQTRSFFVKVQQSQILCVRIVSLLG